MANVSNRFPAYYVRADNLEPDQSQTPSHETRLWPPVETELSQLTASVSTDVTYIHDSQTDMCKGEANNYSN